MDSTRIHAQAVNWKDAADAGSARENRARRAMKRKLQVMKFGGTSVGDASCIARTAKIIAHAAREGACVAVVSAMSGVTNRLIEAAKRAGASDGNQGVAVLDALRKQHE